MTQLFNIQNEYAALQKVILGTAQGIKPNPDHELQAGLPATSQLYTQPDPVVAGREFSGVLEYMKLGAPCALMICLEWWAYQVMYFMSGYFGVAS